jgi:amino acid transporter
MNKKLGIVVWFLAFVLSVFFLLILSKSYDLTIWITLGFTIVTYVSQLILFLCLFSKQQTPDGVFYNTPTMTISSLYMITQMIICIAVPLVNWETKVVLTVNFVGLILMWIVLCGLLAGKSHAKRIDSRQKDHHTVL